MTSVLAKKLGSRGTVMAFEPNPAVFNDLCHNTELFSKAKNSARIIPLNLALSAHTGIAQLICGGGVASNNGTGRLASGGEASEMESTTVTTTTLDEICRRNRVSAVSVMKVDVEGHENEVFQGGTELLKAHLVDHVIFEDFEGIKSEAAQFLMRNGYTLLRLVRHFRGPLLCSAEGEERAGMDTDVPSFIATVRPEVAARAFLPSGWKVLSAGD